MALKAGNTAGFLFSLISEQIAVRPRSKQSENDVISDDLVDE